MYGWIRMSWLLVMIVGGLVTMVCAGQWEIDLESGALANGYNVVRIPGDSGTQVSLTDAFEIKPQLYGRLKLFYQFNEQHGVGALVAPLTLTGDGVAGFPITFEDQTFAAGTPLQATFRFDSYRLTYRYRFWKTDRWTGHIGFTGKIRDAEISLKSDTIQAQKLNTGFVPLVYLRLVWAMTASWQLILDADALAAPQGRAEDVLLAVGYQLNDQWKARLGYRFVEGGADNDEVFNFTAVHYGAIGITAHY